MKKLYTVQVSRSYFRDIEVKAESEDAAVREAKDIYDLDGDDILTRDTRSMVIAEKDL